MISYEQLERLGLDQGDVAYRVRIGRLHPLYRAVFAVGHRKLTWQGRWKAATLAVTGSILSHISAVMAYGMLRPGEGDIHVTTRTPKRPRKGIRTHTDPSLDAAFHDTIAISPPATAIRELCSMRTVPDRWCLRAMNQALVLELVTMDDLFEEAYSRRIGAKRLKKLIWSAAPARSGLEDETIAKLRQAGFPPFKANLRLHDHEVDLYLPGQNLVVELNPARYHANPFAAAYDRWKRADLERRGKQVLWILDGEDAAAAISSAVADFSPFQ